MIPRDMGNAGAHHADSATEAADGEDRPSKTQRKRVMSELQDIGEALVALSDQRLAALELPEQLRHAVLEARRIRKFGALRRQLQYIGRVMRAVDAAPIREQLARLEGQSRAETAWLHRLERWRTRLLDDDDALTSLLAEYASADAQYLRTLIRNARRERDLGRPPRAYRDLFQALREIVPRPPAASDAVDAASGPP